MSLRLVKSSGRFLALAVGLALGGAMEYARATEPVMSAVRCSYRYRTAIAGGASHHLTRMTPRTEADFLRNFSTFDGVLPADNEAFIKALAEREFYFVWDMGALQDLNNVILKDKPLATAVTNFGKELVFQKAIDDPVLGRLITETYSDYKSLKVALDQAGPEVGRALARITAEAQAEFARVLNASELAARYQGQPGVWGRPELWQAGSTGRKHGDLANQAAKSNYLEQKNLLQPVFKDFAQHEAKLQRQVQDIESLRAWIVQDAVHHTPVEQAFLLKRTEEGQQVLTNGAVALLRSLRKDGQSEDELAALFEKELLRRFPSTKPLARADGSPTDEALRRHEFAVKIVSYFREANEFASALLQGERVVINLNRAREGVVSFDFKGLGAMNVAETMRALAGLPPHATAADAVRAARLAEQRVTKWLEELKGKVDQSFPQRFRAWLRRTLFFSGDDGIYMPTREFTALEKQELVNGLHGQGIGGHIRLTFLSKKFRDLQADIPTDQKSAFIVRAEKIEKEIDLALAGTRLGEAFRNHPIGIDYAPSFRGNPSVRLVLDSSVSAEDRRRIENLLRFLLKRSGAREEVVWMRQNLNQATTGSFAMSAPVSIGGALPASGSMISMKPHSFFGHLCMSPARFVIFSVKMGNLHCGQGLFSGLSQVANVHLGQRLQL